MGLKFQREDSLDKMFDEFAILPDNDKKRTNPTSNALNAKEDKEETEKNTDRKTNKKHPNRCFCFHRIFPIKDVPEQTFSVYFLVLRIAPCILPLIYYCLMAASYRLPASSFPCLVMEEKRIKVSAGSNSSAF